MACMGNRNSCRPLVYLYVRPTVETLRYSNYKILSQMVRKRRQSLCKDEIRGNILDAASCLWPWFEGWYNHCQNPIQQTPPPLPPPSPAASTRRCPRLWTTSCTPMPAEVGPSPPRRRPASVRPESPRGRAISGARRHRRPDEAQKERFPRFLILLNIN